MNATTQTKKDNTMKTFEKIEVTFQKNVCCHTYFLDLNTMKRIGELHRSMSYGAFFTMIEKKRTEIFSFRMDVSVLDQRTITLRKNKVRSLGFEIEPINKSAGNWIASR